MTTILAEEAHELLILLLRRYGTTDMEALKSILTPALIAIESIDRNVEKITGQGHYRATFTIKINPSNSTLLQKGRTGKFVPKSYVDGKLWREIAKGRILHVDSAKAIAIGEIYIGSSNTKADLEIALSELRDYDFLEIDQYGASPKILSSLVEYNFASIARESGFAVVRMPEDTAKHIGVYPNYDFELTKDGVTKKVEVKSLWGTDTRKARLIHSTGKDYPTSSCKFATQDIFAVSLFLRSGNVGEFAFAKSEAQSLTNPNGLPAVPNHPDHVTQNPRCIVDKLTWFDKLDDVWN